MKFPVPPGMYPITCPDCGEFTGVSFNKCYKIRCNDCRIKDARATKSKGVKVTRHEHFKGLSDSVSAKA